MARAGKSVPQCHGRTLSGESRLIHLQTEKRGAGAWQMRCIQRLSFFDISLLSEGGLAWMRDPRWSLQSAGTAAPVRSDTRSPGTWRRSPKHPLESANMT